MSTIIMVHNTETVLSISPFLQANITSWMWPSAGNGQRLALAIYSLLDVYYAACYHCYFCCRIISIIFCENMRQKRPSDLITSKMLCQLLFTWVTRPESLNIIWCSVFELTVSVGQTDGRTGGMQCVMWDGSIMTCRSAGTRSDERSQQCS